MRILSLNFVVLLMVVGGISSLRAAESVTQEPSDHSLIEDINSHDIKTLESNSAKEINRLMAKITEDYQALNKGKLKVDTEPMEISKNSSMELKGEMPALQQTSTTVPVNMATEKEIQKSMPDHKAISPVALAHPVELSDRDEVTKSMVEKQDQLLFDIIELQKQIIHDVDMMRDTWMSQSYLQPLADKKAVSSPDYIVSYAKNKGVHLDPSGFAYLIMKKGSPVVTPGMLFKINLEESTTRGKTISKIREVTLKYDDKLPRLVYRAVAIAGIGGVIKVVAHASDTYSKKALPDGIKLDTPLVYRLSTSYP